MTASEDTTAKLWEVPSGRMVRSFQHQRPVGTAAFSPDGSRVVTTSYDGATRLWDTQSGALLFTLQGDGTIPLSAAFSGDGRHLVSASEGSVKLWDAATGKAIATFDPPSGYAHSKEQLKSAPQWIRNHQRKASQPLNQGRIPAYLEAHKVTRTASRAAGEDRRSPRSCNRMPIGSTRRTESATYAALRFSM